MAKKAYTLTLDADIVNKALLLSKFYGGKLSPLVNNLIKEWIKTQEESQ